MSLPTGIKTRIVTGTYTDTYILNGGEATRPTEGYVVITTSVEAIAFNGELINPEYLESKKFWLTAGTFEAELIVSNDPTIDPLGFTYKAEYSWLSTPVYFRVDPGTTPLILSSEFMADESTGVVIQRGPQGEQGPKGDAGDFEGAAVVGMTQNGADITVSYSDGTTQVLTISSNSASTYEHTQTNSATNWTVTHNLGKRITSVIAYLGSPQSTEESDLVLVPWSHVDNNTVTVHFAADCSGRVIVS